MTNNDTHSGSYSAPLSSGPGDMWLTLLLWLVLMVGAIIMRPLLPIDETRYLSVAWEMHTSGSYMVPHLNGELYSHKPPLLFWLMNAGWTIFGVSMEWARMVAPLFGLGALLLTAKIAKALWRDADPKTLQLRSGLAPLMLLSGVYWSVFSTMTMFDMMLAFSTLVSLLGVVGSWRAYVTGDGKKFWLNVVLIGIGLGIGGLSKGPAILLHVLPVYALAPLWGPTLTGTKPKSWAKWYLSILVAILIGFGIALGWAIPAAIIGGPEYRDAIFIGQTAGRMVKSFAHQRPLWWFVQYLPLLLLPWFAWPRLWRAVGFLKSWREKTGLRGALNDGGVRFIAIWFGVTFIAFSLISGKQLHYLLPEFPAIALFAAYFLSNIKKPKDTETGATTRKHMVPALVLAGLAGIVLMAWAALPIIETYVPRMPSWAYEIAPIWMVPALLLALGASFIPMPDVRSEVRLLAITAASLIVFTHMAVAPALRHAYDLSLTSRLVSDWQGAGKKIAYIGKYHGEFNFLGRLEKPLIILPSMAAAIKWAGENPNCIVVDVVRQNEIKADPIALFPYRGKYMVMWETKNLAAKP